MVPIVLHVAGTAAVSATRPANSSVAPGLARNDFPLQACQHQLSFGQCQTQISDIREIIGAVDLHDADPLLLAVIPNFHQPYSPGHASTPDQRSDAKYLAGAGAPNVETAP